ncbi:alpha/beta hydrolase fold domain-containing protein [Acidisoma cellulosilytica]|uniref:Alpha/beta hydrolase fold domain-containing protein n=1 Tax=Acidisoma cellulosilyticum TaxID=2802395 RepID=A0A963YZ75_9PROT|nr:alpha/beta hydrolase [Acidisoma cellulosilyticum]MCB8879626.1 alpha/beta hydrolase fold domain-containing protein [Acidisoma cellulosilyticum]
MTDPGLPTLIATRHPISEAESAIERALLAKVQQHFAGFTGTMREAYDAMTAQTPIADGMVLLQVDDGAMQGWWVSPADAPADRAILFLHGGAYMLGSAAAYRGFASQVACRTGIATFVLDYPLAPEHPFPAAFDAAIAARRWLASRGFTQIALIGDSAGGALTLGVLQDAEGQGAEVASVVVLSPWLDLALTGASFNAETYDPIFKPQILAKAAETYLAGADPRDGRASPLYDLPAALPPLAIQVGTDEILLDDSRRYAEAAANLGGAVHLDIYEGLHHVFQRSVTDLPAARLALDNAASFITRHWRS